MTAPGNGGEMLERVARELTVTLRHHGVEMDPDDIKGLAWDAVATMREPTRGMISAGSDEIDYSDFAGKLPSDGLAAAWRRMIGEALYGVQDEYDAPASHPPRNPLPVAAQAPGHLLGRVSQHDDAPIFSGAAS